MAAPLHAFAFPAAAKLLPAALFAPARRLRLALRPSFVALLTLLALAAFCLFHQHLNDAAPRAFAPPPPPPHRTPHRAKAPPRPQIALAPAEELAAVIAFIAALPSNALPDAVDPARPLDPDLVLEFDTRTPKARPEVRRLVEETWARLPVVVLSKRYSPAARELKQLLAEYSLAPAPTVFELDERADAGVLTPLVFRLTAAADLPVLLVGGQPVGPLDAVRRLHASGELRALVAASGAVVDGARKKKKGRRAAAA